MFRPLYPPDGHFIPPEQRQVARLLALQTWTAGKVWRLNTRRPWWGRWAAMLDAAIRGA